MSETRITKYRGVLQANTGTLLGGVRRHVSIWFDSRDDAKAWTAQAIDANKSAGRDLGECYVEPRQFLKAKKNPRRRARKNPSPPVTTSAHIGERIQLHPATDAWMRGDRYGEIVKIGRGVRRYHVRLDKSGRTVRLSERDIYEFIEPQRNPRRRSLAGKSRQIVKYPASFKYGKGATGFVVETGGKIHRFATNAEAIAFVQQQKAMRKNPKSRRAKLSQSQMLNRKARVRVSGRKIRYQRFSAPGASKRFRMAHGDPRRFKRKIRKLGYRVNPTARRKNIIVYAMPKAGGTWRQIAAFGAADKPMALDYARALARANPRATIKVEKK